MGTAKLFAVGAYEPAVQKFPELLHCERLDDWDFFTTVAIVGSCEVQVALFTDVLGRRVKHALQQKFLDEFRSFHRSARSALDDLKSFVERALPDLADARDLPEVIKSTHQQFGTSIGMWLLWNLKGQMPEEAEYHVANTLGYILYADCGYVLAREMLDNCPDTIGG